MISVILKKQSGDTYNISDLIISSVDFEDNINKSGILTLEIDKAMSIEEGNLILLSKDNNAYFSGFIFRIAEKPNEGYKITAYDQLRYLKTQDTYVFKGIPATKAISQICNDYNVKTGVLQDTQYLLPELVFDNKNILDIISDCIVATMTKTSNLYFIKDNCGLVELRNINSTVSDICIDPDWLVYDFDFERSIDDNTYNQIKLIQDNKTTGARDMYISKDSSTIQKWGLLQYVEKVDEGLNASQIKQMADAYLSLKNKVKRNLSINIIGDKRVRAGNVICINLPQIGIKDFLLCTYAKHTFDGTGHVISATFRIV